MSEPRIAAFARLVNGNVAPKRIIKGQATKFGRTVHGIAYDPVHDEIIVPNPLAAAILFFRGGATGDEAPLRIIQGAKTQLSFPHAVSVDAQHNEIIVGDPGGKKVLFFPLNAQGDVAPLRVIKGSKTKLGYIVGAAVDPVSNVLVIASSSIGGASGLFMFNRTDDGDVAPRAIILGPKTNIQDAPWQVEIWQGKIFVSVANTTYRPLYQFDKPRASEAEIRSPWNDMRQGLGFIGVWNITDNGDVAPRAIIRGPITGLIHPTGLALNPQHGEVLATDSVRNGTFTFLVPEFFQSSEKR